MWRWLPDPSLLGRRSWCSWTLCRHVGNGRVWWFRDQTSTALAAVSYTVTPTNNVIHVYIDRLYGDTSAATASYLEGSCAGRHSSDSVTIKNRKLAERPGGKHIAMVIPITILWCNIWQGFHRWDNDLVFVYFLALKLLKIRSLENSSGLLMNSWRILQELSGQKNRQLATILMRFATMLSSEELQNILWQI